MADGHASTAPSSYFNGQAAKIGLQTTCEIMSRTGVYFAWIGVGAAVIGVCVLFVYFCKLIIYLIRLQKRRTQGSYSPHKIKNEKPSSVRFIRREHHALIDIP